MNPSRRRFGYVLMLGGITWAMIGVIVVLLAIPSKEVVGQVLGSLGILAVFVGWLIASNS